MQEDLDNPVFIAALFTMDRAWKQPTCPSVEAEKGHVDTGWEGEGGMNWGIRIDVYTLPCAK